MARMMLCLHGWGGGGLSKGIPLMKLRPMSCMALSVANAQVLPNKIPVTVWIVATVNGLWGVWCRMLGVSNGEKKSMTYD